MTVSTVRCGRAAWPPTPSMLDVEMIGRRHDRARPDRELPDRQARIIVHAVDLADPEPVHQPVLDHRLAAGAALLRRLEDHHRIAGEIAGLGEIAGGAEQHGGMAVMAAGMHLARHRRLVRQAGRFLDRQRVHVGAQPDRLGRPCRRPVAADDPDHAGPADARHHLVAAEALELLGHRGGGAVHVVLQLGMGMQVAPPGGDVVVQVGNAIDDRHREGSMRAPGPFESPGHQR